MKILNKKDNTKNNLTKSMTDLDEKFTGNKSQPKMGSAGNTFYDKLRRLGKILLLKENKGTN